MQLVLTIAFLSLLLWFEPAAAQTSAPPHPLEVRHHPSIGGISESAVRGILDKASDLLKSEINHHCDVTFKLVGLKPFESKAPKNIREESDLEAVQREKGDVKVVETIDFCLGRKSKFEGEFIGCSWRRSGPRTMIVTHTQVEPGIRGILWAHEFGHTRGLRHRVGGGEALMSPCTLLGDNIRITANECRHFRSDRPARPKGIGPRCPDKR